MSGRIPHEFIEQVLARVDVVEIINQRVPLKKAGGEYKACCPFHNEKTPSFTVSPSKQFYHCFGCGAHGTAIGFLIDYEHLSLPEAVEALAQHIGLPMPERNAARVAAHTPLFEALAAANRYFQRQLREHPQSGAARAYLKSRGLDGEIAKRFNIGFAPPGFDNLRTALTPSFSTDVLERCGLLIRRQDHSGHYDRFRARVTFPIRDRLGKVIGFGGRVINADDQPKYLNSPETPIYHKGDALYGFYEARQATRDLRHLLVVEGYMDVISLAQFGVTEVVATLGTAATEKHIQRLFRTVPKVVFCFDGDRAGHDAAWRALQTTLPLLDAGNEARFLFLPDGDDPDTLVREHGAPALRDRQAAAITATDFLFQRLTAPLDLDTLEGRGALAKAAKALIGHVRDAVLRELMLNRLNELTGLSVAGLSAALPAAPAPAKRPPQRAGAGHAPRSAVRVAIGLLLNQPSLAELAGNVEDLTELHVKGVHWLIELLDVCRDHPTITPAALLERYREQRAFTALADAQARTHSESQDSAKAEFSHRINELHILFIKQQLAQLRASDLTAAADQQRYRTLENELQQRRQSSY